MTVEATESNRLDRRGALRALFGLAVVAAGGAALLAPSQAEAAPATPSPEGLMPEATPAAAQDMASDADLPEAEKTQYYYYRRRYRPRRVVYVRPVRRRVVYVRPRRVYYVRRRRYW